MHRYKQLLKICIDEMQLMGIYDKIALPICSIFNLSIEKSLDSFEASFSYIHILSPRYWFNNILEFSLPGVDNFVLILNKWEINSRGSVMGLCMAF